MRRIKNMVSNLSSYFAGKEPGLFNSKLRKDGSALIGEIVVLVIILMLAVAYKTGALAYINDMWQNISNHTSSLWI